MASLQSRQLENNYNSAIAAGAHKQVTNPAQSLAAAEKAKQSKLSWVQQTSKAKAILAVHFSHIPPTCTPPRWRASSRACPPCTRSRSHTFSPPYIAEVGGQNASSAI